MNVRTVGVVGCGLMGTGIVEVAAQAGLRVIAVKATPGSIEGARQRVRTSLERAVSKGNLSPEARDLVLGRIEFDEKYGANANAALYRIEKKGFNEIESCSETE